MKKSRARFYGDLNNVLIWVTLAIWLVGSGLLAYWEVWEVWR